MKRNTLTCLLAFFVLLACSDDDVTTVPPEPMEPALTKISITGDRFTDQEGNNFMPWGVNYTNPVGIGLIDDNWFDPAIWTLIETDFSDMKKMNVNTVRIHLQYHRFMLDVNTPNQAALDQLQKLVELAEEKRMYLDVTGLGAYRKSDQPAFYLNLTDEERWATHAVFWENIAEKIGGSPAVFAFNLMNEPVVSVDCDGSAECDWTPGTALGEFQFVQNITRTPGNRSVLTLKEWIGVMTEAIRAKDSSTPITYGSLALGSYNLFSSDLSYLSPHMYPRHGELDVHIDRVKNNPTDVPVVIEEIFNLHCSTDDIKEFLAAIDGDYQGLMGHYFGTPIEELTNNTIADAIQKDFYEFIRDNNPN